MQSIRRIVGWVGSVLARLRCPREEINRRAPVDTERDSVDWVDQDDGGSLVSFVGTVDMQVNATADEGLHAPKVNSRNVAERLPPLAHDGCFIVEDRLPQQDESSSQWQRRLPSYYGVVQYPGIVLLAARNDGSSHVWRYQG